jgi:hypothetical protein
MCRIIAVTIWCQWRSLLTMPWIAKELNPLSSITVVTYTHPFSLIFSTSHCIAHLKLYLTKTCSKDS